MHRQVGMTLLCMCEGFSHLNEEADDCDVIRWCHYCSAYVNEREVYKEVCMSPRCSSLVGSGWFIWQATGLCLNYLAASWGVGLSPYRKAFFICSFVCAQGYLGHPELVCFSCLWVSWVACHHVSIWPSTREARTTALWQRVAHVG